MDLNEYNGIAHFINTYKGLSRECLYDMIKLFPNVPAHTLGSILCTKYQKKMMMNHGRVKQNRKNVIQKYEAAVAAKEEPGLIIRLAKQYDVAPALMAKVVLEEKSNKGKKDDNQLVATSKNMIKEMLNDSTKIPDPDLAYEVFLSIVFDNMYGHISDTIKHALGIEYEVRLCHEVERLGLSYKSEDMLRARGYDKTPDVRLDTPCAVDGFIINWVESKALFADPMTHQQYCKDQYLSYWNRFGPGLVIYWFGIVKTVNDPSEKRFIVRDSFPKNITLMDPSIIEVPKLKLF